MKTTNVFVVTYRWYETMFSGGWTAFEVCGVATSHNELEHIKQTVREEWRKTNRHNDESTLHFVHNIAKMYHS